MISASLTQAATMVGAAKGASKELARLKTTTDGFEALFLKDLMQEMRKGVQQVKLGQSFGADTYQAMFDESVSEQLAAKGSLGIGQMLYKPMSSHVIAQQLAANRAKKTTTVTENPSAQTTAKD